MSYRFQPDEAVHHGLRRIVREQADKASAGIDAVDVSLDDAVHEVRKRCKKVRAAFRLVRDAMPGQTYQRENTWYRDIARPLAEAREAAVALETIDAMIDDAGDDADLDALRRVCDALTARRRRVSTDAVLETLDDARGRLREGVERLEELELQEMGFDAVAGGLRRTYARNHRAWRAAYAERTATAFHEWRKRAKYHRHHCDLLRELWEKPMKGREKALHFLTDRLGDAHDLSDLLDVLEQLDLASSDRARAGRIATERRAQHRLRAMPEALRAFAEKPKRFVGRMEAYWHAWAIAHDRPPTPRWPDAAEAS